MILSVAFGKGGTGKTSTTCALANLARMNGLKTLVIDCDTQGNSTFALGGDLTAAGLYSILTGKAHAADVIQHTQQADIVSAGLDMAEADSKLKNLAILKDAIQPLRRQYDLILLDCPPGLSRMTKAALAASDSVLLPMLADSFSVMGLYLMQQAIEDARAISPELQIAGILLIQYKPKQTLASDLRSGIDEMAHSMETKVFKTFIRDSVAVGKAQARQQSLFDYAPRSNPAADYAALYKELKLKKERK